jgi:hypothetical protein
LLVVELKLVLAFLTIHYSPRLDVDQPTAKTGAVFFGPGHYHILVYVGYFHPGAHDHLNKKLLAS